MDRIPLTGSPRVAPPRPLSRKEAGKGQPFVLVHGSAATADDWLPLQKRLSKRHRVIAYDRRGSPGSPLAPPADRCSVDRHARDLIEILESLADPGPVVCGSSFGAVIVLEATLRRPELPRGIVLCEPPLPAESRPGGVPSPYRPEYDRICACDGPEAGALFFLRTVLGDAAFEALPERTRQRASRLGPSIRLDADALDAHPIDYRAYASLRLPCLLLGGDRSPAFFGETLRALHTTLADARLEQIPSAGHAMQGDNPAACHAALTRFVTEIS